MVFCNDHVEVASYLSPCLNLLSLKIVLFGILSTELYNDGQIRAVAWTNVGGLWGNL